MLVLLLLALGINALAPAGHMIAPGEHGLPTVSVCPETHPLVRAIAASREQHAMKGHSRADHAGMDHMTDAHARMGHADEGDERSSATPDEDCALAGVAQLAIQTIGDDLLAEEMAYAVLIGLASNRPLALRPPTYLRPPLRGPPSAI
ncbi:hypothetical protein [Qipengyuania sp. MTN3-11]|uniref:hypothetical protein n=1 Tax=Qipengyuania sp. MTN3-11 TaxID=3056557 RepID=UPI0036F2355B